MLKVKNRDELRQIIEKRKIPLDTLDVSAVTDFTALFQNINKISGSVANWQTSQVTNLDGLFYQSKISPDISSWNANERIINNSLLIVNEDKR